MSAEGTDLNSARERRRVYPRRERGSAVEQPHPPGELMSLGPKTVPEANELGFGIEITLQRPAQSDTRRSLGAGSAVGGSVQQVEAYGSMGVAPNSLVRRLEEALREGDLDGKKWHAWESQAQEICHQMEMEHLVRTFRAFVVGIPAFDVGPLLFALSSEATQRVPEASSAQLVQLLHWMSRAGLRDAALAHVIGNEVLLRVSDNFVIEMILEVLNALGQLDMKHPRLLVELIRELTPNIPNLTMEQCLQCSPVMLLNVLTDTTRMQLLGRFAEMNLCVPAAGHKESSVRSLRMLELGLRSEHRSAQIPTKVLEWMSRIRNEAERTPTSDSSLRNTLKHAAPLSRTEKDVFRVIVESLKLPCEPVVYTGLFLLHLVVTPREEAGALESRQVVIEVHGAEACFRAPDSTHKGLLRPEVKFRQRLLSQTGWKVVQLNEEEWWEMNNDEQKAATVQAVLDGGSRRKTWMSTVSTAALPGP